MADTRALFAAITGMHPADPLSYDPRPAEPVPIEQLRIAYSPQLGLGLPLDADVRAAVDAASGVLHRRGLSITEADPEWPPGTAEARILAIEDAGLANLLGARWRAAPELFDPHIGWQIERGLGRSGADIAAAHAFSLGIAAALARFFVSWDLLLCPTTACVAWAADRLDPETVAGRPAAHRDHAAFTPLFNHARTPAISIPCGTGDGGLPVGLQIVGPRLADWRVLAAASWMERALAEG